MALQTRRYALTGPTTEGLGRFVDSTSAIMSQFPIATVDIQIDDAVAGVVATLDEYMASLGFSFIAENVPTRIFAMAGDPAPEAGRVQVYGKDVSGTTFLFARDSAGIIYRITPLGGVAALPELWAFTSLLANQANIPLLAQVSTNFDTVKVIRPGSIVGLGTRLVLAVTAGTLTIEITLNGAGTGLLVTHDAGVNSSGGNATSPGGTILYAAGDLIGVRYTSTVGYLPLLNNAEAWVQVLEPTS